MNGVFGFPDQASLINFGLDLLFWWFVGLVILVVIGLALSHLTLNNITHFRGQPSLMLGIRDRLLRNFYRLVIFVASLYFYISVPVLFFALIAASLLVLYLWYMFVTNNPGQVTGSRQSIFTLLLPGLLSLILFYSAIQVVLTVVLSVLLPMRGKMIGRPLTRVEAPGMWTLTDEVAAKVGTRRINRIYLRPEIDIAVVERGFFPLRMIGMGRRCLFLGLGTLPGMTQGAFKAILAHEYGHFAHRDTAGGGLALQVRISLAQVAISLKMEGMANWSNPAWLFISGFTLLFEAITQGASRVQEILADRRAVLTYGAHEFVEGLNHVAHQQLRFAYQVNQEIEKAVKENRPLHNLYTLPPLEAQWETDIRIRLQREAKQPKEIFDSHPTLPERIELAKALNTPAPAESNPAPVWDLLPAAALQEEMTAYIQRKVQRQIAQMREQWLQRNRQQLS
jgi:Zn-dependent protease with chaperone function